VKYRLTPNATRGLSQILARIEATSPAIADKWKNKFLLMFEHLAAFPSTGHPYFGLEDLPVRARSVGPYLVFFRPNTQPLQIVAVEHGAQNLPATLRPKVG
jgi:plasmid stabilization system protein ParE